MLFVTFPFFFMVELQNFLNARRISHFRDDLPIQSLDCCKNPVFPSNHLSGTSEPNPSYNYNITQVATQQINNRLYRKCVYIHPHILPFESVYVDCQSRMRENHRAIRRQGRQQGKTIRCRLRCERSVMKIIRSNKL